MSIADYMITGLMFLWLFLAVRGWCSRNTGKCGHCGGGCGFARDCRSCSCACRDEDDVR